MKISYDFRDALELENEASFCETTRDSLTILLEETEGTASKELDKELRHPMLILAEDRFKSVDHLIHRSHIRNSQIKDTFSLWIVNNIEYSIDGVVSMNHRETLVTVIDTTAPADTSQF